jgi:hypothetical protein
VIQCLSKGLLVSSLFCFTTLLCLHQCIPTRISLIFLFFFSVSECTPHLSLPLSDNNLCSISFLCSLWFVSYFHSMHYASSVHFSSYTQHASTCMNNSQQKQPSLLFLRVFIMPSPLVGNTLNSSSSLAIILSLFFISGRYPEILWLLWQLQSSTHFHLSIV